MFSNRWIRMGLIALGTLLAIGIIGGIVMRIRVANNPELAAQFAERREGHRGHYEDCLAAAEAEDGDADAIEDCKHVGRDGKDGRRGGHGHRRGGFGIFRLVGGLLRLAVVAALAAAMLNWWNKRKAAPTVADTDATAMDATDPPEVVDPVETVDPVEPEAPEDSGDSASA